MNQWNWIERWALYAPEKQAVREYETNRSLTYAEFYACIQSCVQWLYSVLAHQGDVETYAECKGLRIAIYAENSLEHFILFGVAQCLGIILVPLNYRSAPPEIAHYVHDIAPSLIIVEEMFAPILQPCAVSAERIIPLADLQHRVAEWKQQHANSKNPRSQEYSTSSFPEIYEQDPALILYTGGSTGLPKGVMYTHGMALWNSINTGLRLSLTEQDHTITCLPLFHTGGFHVLSTPFLHHGASLLLMKSFSAEVVTRLLEEESVTVFMGVPTILKMMAETQAFQSVRLTHLRYFIVGGEPMPIPLIETWQNEKGVAVRQGFGMTESGPNLFSLHQNDAMRKIGSIGFPNFYVETKLLNDQDEEVKRGEHGELFVRGPMNTIGYWNNEEATRATLRDGWLATGDIMRQDEEGFFYVVDRKKNMYISGGENVYPAEVERVLNAHPALRECAITAVPDAQWGETGKAWIVLHEGQSVSEEELLQYLRSHVARYKCPKHIIFLDQLPKNDAGKIDRRALRQK